MTHTVSKEKLILKILQNR